MIIDFHTHCFADGIAKNAVAQLEKVGGISAFSDGTTGGLLENMQRAGIDKSVVMPVCHKAVPGGCYKRMGGSENRR